MNYQDSYLDEIRKPLYFADEGEEEELFTEDGLVVDEETAAAQEEEEARATAEAAAEAEAMQKEAEAAAAEAERKASLRIGIKQGVIGYAILVFASIIPLFFLVLYMITQKTSLIASVFTTIFFIGWILSIFNLIYYSKNKDNYYTSFDLMTFFKWPEIATITVILFAISFINLMNLSKGEPISLSQKSLINPPRPVVTTSSTPEEHEEISFRIAVTTKTNETMAEDVKKSKTVTKVDDKEKTQKKVFPIKKEQGETTKEIILVPAVGGLMGILRAPSPLPPTPPPSEAVPGVTNRTLPKLTPLVKTWYLQGALCGALGYAFPLAIAGAIFALFRRFNTPFSSKTMERINQETGEIISETESKSFIHKLIDIIIFKIPVGFTFGGTLGFILGVIVIVPLYIIFGKTSNIDVANFITVLGVVKNPDLAYTYGIIVAGFFVPLTLLVIGKFSPVGLSVSDTKIKEIYSLPPATITVPAVMSDKMLEPVAIVFDGLGDINPDELLTELSISNESVTSEILAEYGDDIKAIFQLKELPIEAKPNGKKSADRAKIAAVIEESFGELGNINVQISAELGEATIPLTDWLNIKEGTLIELNKSVGEEIDILFNGVRKGKGKLTLVENYLGVEVSNSDFSISN